MDCLRTRRTPEDLCGQRPEFASAPLACHLQGTQQVSHVQSFACLVAAAVYLKRREGKTAEAKILKVGPRAFDRVLDQSKACAIKSRFWLVKGLPLRNLIYQAPNPRVTNSFGLPCSLPCPSVDGDNLPGEKEALPLPILVPGGTNQYDQLHWLWSSANDLCQNQMYQLDI